MKCFALLAVALATRVSPIEKTIQLLEDLEAKVMKDGENAQKVYEEFEEYCKSTAKETAFEIKTGKGDAERASASIDDFSAKIDNADTSIEELSSAIASDEKDLKSATEIRKKEAADFAKVDADLSASVDMLERAIGIIEREMAKNSFVQTGAGMTKVVAAIQALLDGATAFDAGDKLKLQSLLQAGSGDESLDLQPAGAPDPAAYKSQSGGIVSAMEDMLEKARAEQSDGQKAEMTANHNFEMLKQKLEDAIKVANNNLDETKANKAAYEEGKAEAQGVLDATTKQKGEDETKLKDVQTECMTKAEAFEVEQHERAGELEALAKAKKILVEKTGGAADRAYSLLQTQTKTQTAMQAHLMEVKGTVVKRVQQLAQETGNPTELVQLAERMRMTALMSADPFSKVKGMIQEMIEKLVSEAKKEAEHKAFCDKEMSETKAKRDAKQDDVDDLTTKIDQASAKIAKLKEGIATLTKELGDIAAAQKEATELREKEKAAWASAKADYESGLEGVGMALQVLRDYYAEQEESLLQTGAAVKSAARQPSGHSKSSGAASGIIGMLEVVESDFSKLLAEGAADEEAAQNAYEEMTQENKITTATKETEVKYMTKDQKETENALVELQEDLGGSQKELAAILEYWEKLQPMCVAKPEPYEERKARREKEIAGLKQALEILEEESAGGDAFLQVRRTVRRA